MTKGLKGKKVEPAKVSKTVVETPDKLNELSQENSQLKSTIEEMKKMIEGLVSKSQEKETVEVIKYVEKEESEYIDIPLNKVIKVMSLYVGGLNLKTSANGKGFRFNNFGDIQPIIYNDLIQIMSYQNRFCNEGYFMILDKEVIKAHALEDNYKKILDAKQIKNILEYDDAKITEFFTSTTQNIRESIISIVVDKINNDNKLDKNKVHLLSELYGADLFAYARGDYEALVNSKIKL
jgi:hypothetical protein